MKRCFFLSLLAILLLFSCATTKNTPSVTSSSTPVPPATSYETAYFPEINSKGRGSVCFIKADAARTITGVKVNRYYLDDSPPLVEVINELLSGPTDSEKEEGLVSFIPSGTRLLLYRTLGSTSYLSLSENFMINEYGAEGYRLQLIQVIETLKEFPIQEVQFLIEGKKIDYLGENNWIGSPLQVNPEAGTTTWRAKQDVIEEERQKMATEEFNNFAVERKNNSPILISLYYTEKPNSANGISCSIQFTNISDKRIKYIYFTVTPYNRVNDITYSDIRRLSTTEIEVVDYIMPYESYHASWENVWYNSTIAYMKIVEIRIIFDDNSTLTIEDQGGLDKAILTLDEYKRFSRFLRVNKEGTS
jgi:hypothetical protein